MLQSLSLSLSVEGRGVTLQFWRLQLPTPLFGGSNVYTPKFKEVSSWVVLCLYVSFIFDRALILTHFLHFPAGAIRRHGNWENQFSVKICQRPIFWPPGSISCLVLPDSFILLVLFACVCNQGYLTEVSCRSQPLEQLFSLRYYHYLKPLWNLIYGTQQDRNGTIAWLLCTIVVQQQPLLCMTFPAW